MKELDYYAADAADATTEEWDAQPAMCSDQPRIWLRKGSHPLSST